MNRRLKIWPEKWWPREAWWRDPDDPLEPVGMGFYATPGERRRSRERAEQSRKEEM